MNPDTGSRTAVPGRSPALDAAAAICEGAMAVRMVFDRLQSTGRADPVELGTGSS